MQRDEAGVENSTEKEMKLSFLSSLCYFVASELKSLFQYLQKQKSKNITTTKPIQCIKNLLRCSFMDDESLKM